MQKRLKEKENRVTVINQQNLDPDTILKLIRKHNYLRDGWKKRKLTTMETLEMIADGSGKKMKDIIVSDLVYNLSLAFIVAL